MIVLFTIGDSIRWAHLEYLMNGRDRISIIKFYISAILLACISNVEILISYLNIIFYYRKYFDLHLKVENAMYFIKKTNFIMKWYFGYL